VWELLHRRCCGLAVHKEDVVGVQRLVSDGKFTTGRSYLPDDTRPLRLFRKWVGGQTGATHVGDGGRPRLLEASVAPILMMGEVELVLANARECEGKRTGARLDSTMRCGWAELVGARSAPGELPCRAHAEPGDAQPAAHALKQLVS